MLKRIVLDVQHIGQPQKPMDRGACYKEFREADLTLKYAALAFQQLTGLGYETFLVTSGTYQERHEWINRHDIELYLACHLNAGGGRYSLVEYCYNARQPTREIAKIMADSFKSSLGTSEGKVIEIPKGGRGEICIENTRPSALILEPMFIDNDTHLRIAVEKPEAIAMAIVETVKSYNEGR